MFQDLRFGVRMLLKQPGFSLIAMLGADSVRPQRRSEDSKTAGLGSVAVDGLANASEVIRAIAAYDWSFNFLVLPNGSESLEEMHVTKDYFRVAGLQPLLGRTFAESESGTKPAPVIILGYNLWQRRFNGDRNIIGKTLS
jgi:putative ABC transport system permease protein